MAQANPYPLRVERAVMEKFKVVASNHGRSVNKEIELLMKQAVADYERDCGRIEMVAAGEAD